MSLNVADETIKDLDEAGKQPMHSSGIRRLGRQAGLSDEEIRDFKDGTRPRADMAIALAKQLNGPIALQVLSVWKPPTTDAVRFGNVILAGEYSGEFYHCQLFHGLLFGLTIRGDHVAIPTSAVERIEPMLPEDPGFKIDIWLVQPKLEPASQDW